MNTRYTVWEKETCEEYDYNDDNVKTKDTGWIVGVVKYAGCGTHEAEWASPEHFALALAAPELLEACKLMETLAGSGEKYWAMLTAVRAAIAKAEGRAS